MVRGVERGHMRMGAGVSKWVVLLWLGAAAVAGGGAQGGQRDGWGDGPGHPVTVAVSRRLNIGTSVLQVDFASGALDLSQDAVLGHVEVAATAISTYFGKFPLPGARVLIVPVANDRGVLQGTTWGGMHGWPGFTRMRIGQHTTAADLKEDWMMTHELEHMAFPTMPDDQHWIEEGLATYVEPVARVMTGDLEARQIWSDMARDMPKGEPREGDKGIDHTHTWGRTYWGGALFCLVADVEIRKETQNKKGLRDALQAVVVRGGTIDHDWDLGKALAIGDQATGTRVLTQMYDEWKDKPVQVELPKLWAELGVKTGADGVEFDASAPLAGVREAITKAR